MATDQADETTIFEPKFSADGLISAIAIDATSKDVLMLAHMNEEALHKTLETGIAHYWSRSRQKLWRKGETSGNEQHIVDVRVDCDQDAVLLIVNVAGDGKSCHTGRNNCFYRSLKLEKGETSLVFIEN